MAARVGSDHQMAVLAALMQQAQIRIDSAGAGSGRVDARVRAAGALTEAQRAVPGQVYALQWGVFEALASDPTRIKAIAKQSAEAFLQVQGLLQTYPREGAERVGLEAVQARLATLSSVYTTRSKAERANTSPFIVGASKVALEEFTAVMGLANSKLEQKSKGIPEVEGALVKLQTLSRVFSRAAALKGTAEADLKAQIAVKNEELAQLQIRLKGLQAARQSEEVKVIQASVEHFIAQAEGGVVALPEAMGLSSTLVSLPEAQSAYEAALRKCHGNIERAQGLLDRKLQFAPIEALDRPGITKDIQTAGARLEEELKRIVGLYNDQLVEAHAGVVDAAMRDVDANLAAFAGQFSDSRYTGDSRAIEQAQRKLEAGVERVTNLMARAIPLLNQSPAVSGGSKDLRKLLLGKEEQFSALINLARASITDQSVEKEKLALEATIKQAHRAAGELVEGFITFENEALHEPSARSSGSMLPSGKRYEEVFGRYKEVYQAVHERLEVVTAGLQKKFRLSNGDTLPLNVPDELYEDMQRLCAIVDKRSEYYINPETIKGELGRYTEVYRKNTEVDVRNAAGVPAGATAEQAAILKAICLYHGQQVEVAKVVARAAAEEARLKVAADVGEEWDVL